MGSNRFLTRRRTVLAGGLTLLAAGPAAAAERAAPGHGHRPGWTGTWAAAPTGVPASADTVFEDQTLRQVVHTSIAGDRLRVRLTNEFGEQPLVVGEAQLARGASGGSGTAIEPGSERVLRFGGRGHLVLPPGAARWSDPVPLRSPAGSDLVVSVYLPRRTRAATVHSSAFQHGYVAAGNVVGKTDIEPVSTNTSWHFLSGVAARTAPGHRPRAVVTLGDSITDGSVTEVGANHRWPDHLARRLREAPGPDPVGVLNAGIGGNRLLRDPNPPAGSPAEDYAAYFGESGLRRFDRDVARQPGVRYVTVLLGVNDLGHPGRDAPVDEEVTAAELIAGHRRLIARSHARGLRVLGGTVLPFKGDSLGFYTPEREAARTALNRWIRTGGGYDGVIDFDAAVRDPADPERLRAGFDSGDGLHPNDAGMSAMAEAVPLRFFR
ncbi:SGNH/GDSL hydrolase family protein [Streptomyces boncukensis]|uniref:SGNH/GDSL hydrolase family protein n=1 Tax=Streptomyces boncukensis TaxID=2711219 RepID=A0A6G4WXX2_9ACTN|nr:SGNH/GDSL hydrolase family protein [Streptomyces boncukensis]NGO69958.1 SGNH/GDSL hydrolase family protein [Streptomyces boncukensis]